jgi:methyl-galactoside transport system permease protein
MEKTKQQKAKDFIINNGVIIVMFILVIYTGLTSDNFLTSNNLMNILMNMSSRLVIALGIAGCVMSIFRIPYLLLLPLFQIHDIIPWRT